MKSSLGDGRLEERCEYMGDGEPEVKRAPGRNKGQREPTSWGNRRPLRGHGASSRVARGAAYPSGPSAAWERPIAVGPPNEPRCTLPRDYPRDTFQSTKSATAAGTAKTTTKTGASSATE